ncbi:MAG: hypothetical protein K0B02_04420 [DPANN group archaeon]|nr:hypothetical protein [DPANN group archaeon]
MEIISPINNKEYCTILLRSKKHNDMQKYTLAVYDFLENFGYIHKTKKTSQIDIYAGFVPTKIKTKGENLYASFAHKIDGINTICMDNDLDDNETIAQITHELVHIIYDIDDEHLTQTITAQIRDSIYDNYDTFTDNRNSGIFNDYSIKTNTITKEKIKDALLDSNIYGITRDNHIEKIKEYMKNANLKPKLR